MYTTYCVFSKNNFKIVANATVYLRQVCYTIKAPIKKEENNMKIKDITSNDARVTLEGRIVNAECKETKTGKLRANKDDESTFNLIMKDKERLLSFDTKLKFILSNYDSRRVDR